MKTLWVTHVPGHFSAVLDTVEHDQEEILLVRNRRSVARQIPVTPRQNARQVFDDLYRTIDDDTADALSAAIVRHRKGRRERVSEL